MQIFPQNCIQIKNKLDRGKGHASLSTILLSKKFKFLMQFLENLAKLAFSVVKNVWH